MLQTSDKAESWLVRYGAMLLATAVAVLVRWALDTWLGNAYPLATLFVAVAVSVWIGGWLPAAIATVLGYLAMHYLFIEPRGSIQVNAATLVGSAAALFSSFVIIVLGELMRGAKSREREATQIVADQASASLVQQARLAAIVESSDDAIIAITPEGVITSFNHGAERLFGYKAEEILACPLAMLLP